MTRRRRVVAALATAGALIAIVILIRLGAALVPESSSSASLPPCPDSPNCVSSLAADPAHAIAPLAFTGSADIARAALERAVLRLPRARIVLAEPRRLRAECRSLVFRFVDDLELVVDVDTSAVHVRSASRLGHSDFGVNRRRVEEIRRLFAEEMARAAVGG